MTHPTLVEGLIDLTAHPPHEHGFGRVAVRSHRGANSYAYGSPDRAVPHPGDIFHLFCLAKPTLILAALDTAERAGITADDRVGMASTVFAPTRLADATLAESFGHQATLDAPKIDDIVLRQPEWLTDWRTGVQSLASTSGYTDWCSSALAVDVIESATGIAAVEVLSNLSDQLGLELIWGNPSEVPLTRQLNYVEHSASRTPLHLRGFWMPELRDILADPTVTATGNVESIAQWFYLLGEYVFHDGDQPAGIPRCAARLASAGRSSERSWMLGVATNLEAHAIEGLGPASLSPASIGHVGWMGRSFVVYDPEARTAIASINPGYDARHLDAIEPHRGAIISDALQSINDLNG